MAPQAAGSSSFATLCTFCLEEVSDKCDRTLVKLKCSHEFHLDCIGSAFNATGVMQCPNCHEIERGIWRRFDDITPRQDMDQNYHDDDHHVTEREQPCECHNCPLHGRIRGSPPSGCRTIIREFDLADGNPNFSHHSFSLHRVLQPVLRKIAITISTIGPILSYPMQQSLVLFFPSNGAPVPPVNITAPPGGACSD